MLQWVLAKVLRTAAVITGAVLVVFLLMHAVPGNPWDNYSSAPSMMYAESDNAFQKELSRRFGLDLPLWRQFTRYMIGDIDSNGAFICGALCGNLGPSILRRGLDVQTVLFRPPLGKTFWKSAFGYSLRLVLLAAAFAVAVGVPLGLISPARPRSALSRAISVALALMISVPNFVLGLLAVLAAALWLRLIPVIPNWDNPYHWIIPAVVLAAMPTANIARVVHSSLAEVLREDYIRAAHAKGLSRARVMRNHALRSALAPIVTFLGPTLMELFTGLFIVENLYGFPGIGRIYWVSVLQLDYPVIMGLTVFYAAGISLTVIAVSILTALLDARVRSARPSGEW